MSERVIVIGAGGHGKVITDSIHKRGDTCIGFLDDGVDVAFQNCDIPVLGKIDSYINYPDVSFVIGIGNAAVRARIAGQMMGVHWYTAVHPAAVISEIDVQVGEGSVIMANAVVNASAHIGKHCILNTASVVEHDNCIGAYSHISVGAKLGGTVTVGEHTWIGIGATVINNVTICDHCIIGAGAVVIHNIKESGTYVGVPAKKIK